MNGAEILAELIGTMGWAFWVAVIGAAVVALIPR